MGGGGADNPADEYAWQTASGLHCSGRIVLNVWRLMRTGAGAQHGAPAPLERVQRPSARPAKCLRGPCSGGKCFAPSGRPSVHCHSCAWGYARWHAALSPGPLAKTPAVRSLPPLHALPPAELKLTSYSFESCVAAVLQLRVPHMPQQQLHAWFAGGPGGGRWRCLQHWVRRARLNLALLDQLDLVGRTGEMARTFGIDFFSGEPQGPGAVGRRAVVQAGSSALLHATRLHCCRPRQRGCT